MPSRGNLQRHRHRPRRHQEAVVDRLVEPVGVGRHAGLEVEQAVGVAVDLVPRRRRQPDEERVEVVEDRPVLLEHRRWASSITTRSKWPGPNRRSSGPHLVDQAHHRRVRRHVHPALAVALGHQVHRRRVGQVRLERVDRLVHQRGAVGEEQDPLGPVGPDQQVRQRDHRAGLAGAGRHDDQRLAGVVDLERLGDPADRTGSGSSARRSTASISVVGQRRPAGAPLDQQLQLVLRVEALHRRGG